MDPPAITAPSRLPSPVNNDTVPVSPKSAPPGLTSPAPNDDSKDEESAHGSSSETINALSLKLLVKVQQFFGKESKEWVSINSALLRFKKGDLSKREAYDTMTQVLGDNYELKQEFFGILDHSDADWGSDDWSQPINPPVLPQAEQPTSPNFLQPSHEPQLIKLPSMYQALGGSPYASRAQLSSNSSDLQSASTPYTAASMAHNPYLQRQTLSVSAMVGFEGYPRYHGHQGQFVPHSQGVPVNWDPNLFTNPNLAPIGFHHDVELSQHVQPYEAQSGIFNAEQSFQYLQHPQPHSWQNGQSMDGWVGNRTWHDAQNRGTEEDPASRIAPSDLHGQATSYWVSGQTNANASPSPLAAHTADPLNIPRSTQAQFDQVKAGFMALKKTSIGEVEGQGQEDANTNRVEPHPEQDDAKPPKAPKTGHFIHAICGKGFHARSAVRKHHWGPKPGDLTTTRGCWAKNKKPDIAWDAHPSCQPATGPSKATTPEPTATGSNDSASISPYSAAPPAPTMLPGPRPAQHSSDIAPYGFDTLISAASLAGRIDAPKPQGGRSDSVVAHLDAQAAVESNGKTLPPWTTPTGFGTGLMVGNSYSQMQPPGNGLGVRYKLPNPIGSNMMLPSQGRRPSGTMGFAPSEIENYHENTSQEESAKAETQGSVNKKRQRAVMSKKGGALKRENKQMETVSSSPERKKAKTRE